MLPDLGLKLFRKSFSLSVQLLTWHCISGTKGFNHRQLSFFPCVVIHPKFLTISSAPCLSMSSSERTLSAPSMMSRGTSPSTLGTGVYLYTIHTALPDDCYGNRKFQGTQCFVCWTGLEMMQLRLLLQNF